jgi:hypothetical protein
LLCENIEIYSFLLRTSANYYKKLAPIVSLGWISFYPWHLARGRIPANAQSRLDRTLEQQQQQTVGTTSQNPSFLDPPE